LSKFTSALVTPLTLVSAFFTVMGQTGQVMPGTARVTVWSAGQTGDASMDNAAASASDFFMGISFQ
jgi:hypothetical protein